MIEVGRVVADSSFLEAGPGATGDAERQAGMAQVERRVA